MPVTTLPTRRAILQVAAVAPLAALAACGTTEGGPTGNADDAVRQSVADSEQFIISRYDATIAAFPALADKLQPLRDQHAEHLAALGSDPAKPDEPAPAVAKTATAAVQALTAAERKAAQDRTASCGQATGGDLIWNLALIASSEAQHAAQLAKGAT